MFVATHFIFDWRLAMRCDTLRAVVVLAALILPGCGSQSYDLETRAAPGDIYRRELFFAVNNGKLTLTAGDQTIEGRIDIGSRDVTEVSILKVRAGKPVQLTIAHPVGTTLTTVEMPGGQPENTVDESPLIGRTILFEKAAKGWTPRLVGGGPNPEQVEALREYGNPWSDDDVVPERKVQVNETWVIGGEPLARLLEIPMSRGVTGTLKGRFDQVADYNGEKCAILSIEFDVSGTTELEGKPLAFSFRGQGEMYRSLVHKIDVRLDIHGKIRYEGDRVEEGQLVHMVMDGNVVISGTDIKDVVLR